MSGPFPNTHSFIAIPTSVAPSIVYSKRTNSVQIPVYLLLTQTKLLPVKSPGAKPGKTGSPRVATGNNVTWFLDKITPRSSRVCEKV